jgi:hypothetical protein
MHTCDNCGGRFERQDLKRVFPDIPDLPQRLSPGGIVPSGECPACGALVYPEREPVRVLVLLEGGLVRDVLADAPGVEAAVLDQDVEGMFDDDLVEIEDEGGGKTLRGTLQKHEATESPGLVEATWRCT